jgi:two-component sensor histidine kinase
MRHLIPFTKDQLQIIQASLQLSLKYADSQYIENVDEIMKEIENNTRFG